MKILKARIDFPPSLEQYIMQVWCAKIEHLPVTTWINILIGGRSRGKVPGLTIRPMCPT